MADISIIKTNGKDTTGAGVNMRRRFLAFFLVLIFAMLAGAFVLISVFGIFPSGIGEAEKLFMNEFGHLSADTSRQYGIASVQSVRLSKQLNSSIASFMKREGLSLGDLGDNPEVLEPLLSEQLSVLLMNLDATECSGVFVVLDATVNPDIPGAEHSKAGLYIRNSEPNIGGTGSETRYLLRGFPSISRFGYINMQAKWDLEFDVEGQLFWHAPREAYEANPKLALSRLIYWCYMSPVQDLNEDVMICAVPIMDSFGRIFGICGFEISEMNFMLRHEPETIGFHNAVFMLSQTDGSQLKLDGAMLSGNNAVYTDFPEQGLMDAVGNAGGFTEYNIPGGSSYVGISEPVKLYPNNSPYAEQSYSASLLIPKTDYIAARNAESVKLWVILLALLAIGIIASFVLSKRYVQPITDNLMAAAENGSHEKTNIVEIDILLDKLRELRSKDSPLPDDLFEDFIARVRTLTPTEKSIFRLYAEGMSAEEVIDVMFISAHTLKTHNKHIYSKLGVSSRDELTLYIELIVKSGREEEIL
ncbi:MAG: LuxR C-terminal-related transcriptional regulator [Clostridiales bacterium]|nr:LuxR C-terminal-related transcriptional regulator [Clostridiales bacterium]